MHDAGRTMRPVLFENSDDDASLYHAYPSVTGVIEHEPDVACSGEIVTRFDHWSQYLLING